jgi:DNA-binding CsgD family transcriptional regulator
MSLCLSSGDQNRLRAATRALLSPLEYARTSDRCRACEQAEAEIVLLLARGLSDREIAEALSISPHTVRTHTMHVFRKLGLHSRKALLFKLAMASTDHDVA